VADDTACTSPAGGKCISGDCVDPNAAVWITEISQSISSSVTNEQKFWTFVTGANSNNVSVTLGGGSGNPDLYVKRNADVTQTAYDCKSSGTGTTETCTSTSAGRFNVLVLTKASYSGVTLVGKWYKPGVAPAPVCGNGTLEGTEKCEKDGQGNFGACCNSDCTFKASGTVCRAAGTAADVCCDNAESCSGTSGVCPTDAFKSENTTCSCDGQTNGQCKSGQCNKKSGGWG
jgi:hypothetical protein